MAVAITRLGAVACKPIDYAAKGVPPLRGLRLPRWASFMMDLIGYAANYDPQLDVSAFDVREAKCRTQKERDTLLACVQAGFASFEPFNQVRSS